MPDGPRIILVGHCGPDSYALRSAVSRAVPGAVVTFANDEAELQAALPTADLLLVNRLLEGGYAHTTGADLIRAVAASESTKKPATMLVSNFPEAQAEAAAKRKAQGDRIEALEGALRKAKTAMETVIYVVDRDGRAGRIEWVVDDELREAFVLARAALAPAAEPSGEEGA